MSYNNDLYLEAKKKVQAMENYFDKVAHNVELPLQEVVTNGKTIYNPIWDYSGAMLQVKDIQTQEKIPIYFGLSTCYLLTFENPTEEYHRKKDYLTWGKFQKIVKGKTWDSVWFNYLILSDFIDIEGVILLLNTCDCDLGEINVMEDTSKYIDAIELSRVKAALNALQEVRLLLDTFINSQME